MADTISTTRQPRSIAKWSQRQSQKPWQLTDQPDRCVAAWNHENLAEAVWARNLNSELNLN